MAGKLAAGGSASKKPVSDMSAGPNIPSCCAADGLPSFDGTTIEPLEDARAEAQSSPGWLVDARKRLAWLASLPHNWDGEGGSSPQPQALRSAQRVLDAVESYQELSPVHIGPSSSGGLGLEWRHENRDLDLDVSPDGSIEYLKSTKVGSCFDMDDMEEGQISPADLGEVRLLVGWLTTGS